MTGKPHDPIDWSPTTWKGSRLQQHREFAALSFACKLELIEQMREAVAFLTWFLRWSWNDGVAGTFRFVPIRANQQFAFAGYAQLRPGTKFQARSIHVLNFRRKKLARVTIFIGPRFLHAFNLPPELGGT